MNLTKLILCPVFTIFSLKIINVVIFFCRSFSSYNSSFIIVVVSLNDGSV